MIHRSRANPSDVIARSSGRGQRASAAWRWLPLLRASVLTFALGSAQGCYTYRPITGQSRADAVLDLTLNDRGRTELSELIGPTATSIEGRLRAEDDTSYMVSVLAIRYANGQNNAWAGESLQVRKSHVAFAREREVSRVRTMLAVALGAAAVAAVVTRGLDARPGVIADPPPGDPPEGN